MLSTKQVDKINDILVQRGITYEPLRIDLVDHICCCIELKMDNGNAFPEALHQSISEFGDLGLERTQEATIYFLTLKLKIMRNFASFSGIIGSFLALSGVILKMLQLPLAGIALVLGAAIIGMIFLPLVLIVKVNEVKSAPSKLAAISGTGSAIVVLFGILFKLMHWPWADKILVIGILIFSLISIPLYFIKSYQQAENKLFNTSLVFCILASVAILSGMIWQKNSGNVTDALASRLENAQLRNELLMKQIDLNQQNHSNPTYLNIVKAIDNTKANLIATSGFNGDANKLDFKNVNWRQSVTELRTVLGRDLPKIERSIQTGLSNFKEDSKSRSAYILLENELKTQKPGLLKNLPLYEAVMELERMKSSILSIYLVNNHHLNYSSNQL